MSVLSLTTPVPRSTSETAESERAIAGSMLLDPRCIGDVLDIVDPRDFADRRIALIVGAIRDMSEAKQPVDVVGVERMVQSRAATFGDGPDAAFSFIAAVAESVVSASGVKHHAQQVREASRAKRIVDAARRVLDLLVRAGVDEVRAMSEQAVELVVKAADREGDRSTTTDMKIAALEACRHVQELYQARESGVSNALLSTGLPPLDLVAGGYPFGQLSIIAGRPAMGKSILGQMAAVAAARAGFGAIYVSAEMPAPRLAIRQLSTSGQVGVSQLFTGALKDDTIQRLVSGAADVATFGGRLMIDDRSGPTIGHIERLVHRFRRQQPDVPLKVMVVDYLQLMRGADSRARADLQIGAYSMGLLEMAKDHGIAVVALSQLSRDCEKRPNKRPMLSDLRESGQLEQDANRVFAIYRDEVYHEDSQEKGTAEILVLKNREGMTGTAKVAFQGEFQRFVPLADASRYSEPRTRAAGGRGGFNERD